MLSTVAWSYFTLIVTSSQALSWYFSREIPSRSRMSGLFVAKRHCLNMVDSGRNLKLNVQGGVISYDYFSSSSIASAATTKSSSAPVGMVYLPGLVRQRNEAKSINLQALCRREELLFLVFNQLALFILCFSILVSFPRERIILAWVVLQDSSARDQSDAGPMIQST